ncbi:PIN domain-containing protein [Prevotella sp. PINT]|jgi:Predicted nucleic acid-binding protein, contains PIN domain|uniref:PIN domain-containing protein n=1 Tax=Palleniella intestinalis TaxID=2736291 RepID=UPI001554248E|nr:PIN domain-containing protein [Palleniella intestinalis]NPD81793.1 PIN domain-containing protein [Palleniella intestinalis]
MDKYLIDTCICIAMIKGNRQVREQVAKVGYKNCYVSDITIAELLVGAEKSGKQKHFNDVSFVMEIFKVIPVSNQLSTYAKTRAYLELKGTRIEDFDLLIGATAIQEKMVMVTANTKHFSRIPNIRLENWEF